MKVSIIGGGGRVGSNAAFALQCAGIVSEIHLLDANEHAAQGEALDEGFRAHLEAMRTEEASLGLARLAHRQPELVYAERAHASFLAFVARAERRALEVLLARDPAHDADVSAPT